jgi:hypothetical protein
MGVISESVALRIGDYWDEPFGNGNLPEQRFDRIRSRRIC